MTYSKYPDDISKLPPIQQEAERKRRLKERIRKRKRNDESKN